MLLKRLILTSFGLYRGEQILDLVPRDRERPIVLVGGHNGAGKTTLLQAVLLCLYGKRALGTRISEQAYTDYIRERVHKIPELPEPLSSCSVAVEFDYTQSGDTSAYFVRRRWQLSGKTLREQLEVLRDGNPLTDVESNFWAEFVQSLIPFGVSSLFFFDGEKIKRLASEENDATFTESVKALLGLDLVERLQADLDVYLSRSARKAAGAKRAKRLEEIEEAVEGIRSELQDLNDRAEDREDKLGGLEEHLEQAERRLAQRGKGLSDRRAELTAELKVAKADRERSEKEIRDLADDALAAAYCPQLAVRLLSQLRTEDRLETWQLSRGEVERALGLVEDRLTQGLVPREMEWGESEAKAIRGAFETARQELLTLPKAIEQGQEVHSLSHQSREQLAHTLKHSVGELASGLKRAGDKLELTEDRLRKVHSWLNQAPEEIELQPLVSELGELQSMKARQEVELKGLAEEERSAQLRLAALERERVRIEDTLKRAGLATEHSALARRVREALELYGERLNQEKVKQLSSAASDCFAKLCRKQDLIREFKIDPISYRVTLCDRDGELLQKTSLSAGEKQIYAISLLWALARVSGRPLPTIVDTPLGRLDSLHRRSLIENYFPRVAHQVLVLSTDTEVDQTFFRLLEPHISHSYYLNNQEGWTKAEPGYFWKEEAVDATTSA